MIRVCCICTNIIALQVDGKDFTVEVIDSVADYLELMKEIFDFPALKTLIKGSDKRPAFKILIDSMNGGMLNHI